MDNLTRDAQKLICLMYKKYLESRKAGKPKSEAKCFGSSRNIQTSMLSKEPVEDVDETCRELSRAKYAVVYYADDMAYDVTISDSAIVYMENRFKNGLVGVIDFLTKVIP